MKKIIVFTAVFLSLGMITSVTAQVRLSVNVNIGSQPVWGPPGYNHVDYYYLPDIETYYYVPSHQFIYLSGNRWVFSTSLPSRYSYYNLNTGYKIVVNEPNAYLNYNQHRVQYSKYRGNWGRQPIIRNSNNPRYYIIKDHPKYKNNPGRGNNKGRNRH